MGLPGADNLCPVLDLLDTTFEDWLHDSRRIMCLETAGVIEADCKLLLALIGLEASRRTSSSAGTV